MATASTRLRSRRSPNESETVKASTPSAREPSGDGVRNSGVAVVVERTGELGDKLFLMSG